MSTKIYCAWRCSQKTFISQFLPQFREHCFEKIAERAKLFSLAIDEELIKLNYTDNNVDKNKYLTVEDFIQKRGDFYRLKEVFKLAKKASSAKKRSLYCFDICFNFWIHTDGKIYIIPVGETWIYEEFKLPEAVEDFAYWNNSDQPENLTRKQWENRGKKWNQICLDGEDAWNRSRLFHDIVNVKENYLGLDIIFKKIFPDAPNWDKYAITCNLDN